MRVERLPSWRRREPFDSIIGRLAWTAEVQIETTVYPIFVVYILSVLTAVVIEVPEALVDGPFPASIE